MPLQGPVDDVVGGPASVVFLGAALDSGGEVLDRRVASDAVLLSKTLVDGRVDGAQLDLALEVAGGPLPVGLEVLAVAAPGGEELDQPHIVRLEHKLLEVALGKLDNIITGSAAAAATCFQRDRTLVLDTFNFTSDLQQVQSRN